MERKQKITRQEYQQLLGLKVLADRHQRAIDDIVAAAAGIVGESKPEGGRFCEVFWGRSESIDDVLRILEMSVED